MCAKNLVPAKYPRLLENCLCYPQNTLRIVATRGLRACGSRSGSFTLWPYLLPCRCQICAGASFCVRVAVGVALWSETASWMANGDFGISAAFRCLLTANRPSYSKRALE